MRTLSLIQMSSPGSAEELVPIIVPIAVFATILAIVVAVLFYRYRTQRLRHDMIAAYLAKGEPLPEWLVASPAVARNVDLRRGLVLLAGGLGLTTAILLTGNRSAAAFGLIPLLIGAAFLIVWKVERRGADGPGRVDGDGRSTETMRQ